jgi:AraC-like DNA-binding protein
LYVVAIDYAHTPARLSFCYTDVLTDVDVTVPLLNADGDLMLIGGVPKSSSFKPTAATWLIHVSTSNKAAATGWPLWKWALLVLTIVAATALLALLFRRRKKEQSDEMPPIELPDEETLTAPVAENLEATDDGEDCAELMRRLRQMMEEHQVYLNPDLKVKEVASTLGTTYTVLSNCIKSQQGCTFPQFVNTYRVELAQQLLSEQPDMKLTEVWTAVGFASESSFNRIFKSITGMTPNEWRSNSNAS